MLKQTVLPAFFLFACLSQLACAGQRVWGKDPAAFLSALPGRSHAVFTAEDTSVFALRELQALPPGAGFYLSFYEFEDSQFAYRLLEYEAVSGVKPFRVLAARRLLRLLIAADLDARAESLGRSFLSLFPDDYLVAKACVEARYWQELDVADDLANLAARFPGEAADDPELALFALVNLLRPGRAGAAGSLAEAGALAEAPLLAEAGSRESAGSLGEAGSAGWSADSREALRVLVMDFAADEVHRRLRAFWRIHGIPAGADEALVDLLLAKAFIVDGEFGAAADLLLPWVEGSGGLLAGAGRGAGAGAAAGALEAGAGGVSTALADDVFRAFSGSGRLTAGLAALEEAVELRGRAVLGQRDRLLHDLARNAGFLARRLGQNAQALAFFEMAREAVDDAFLRRRMLWYMLESEVRTSSALPSRLAYYLSEIDDMPYFSDVFGRMVFQLMQDRSYQKLLDFFLALEAVDAPVLRSQLAYILLRLEDSGLFTHGLDRFSLSAQLDKPDADPYYRGLYLYRANQDALRNFDYGQSRPDLDCPDSFLDDALVGRKVVEGFVKFGLSGELGAFARAAGEELSPAGRAAAARTLASLGDYSDSMRLALGLESGECRTRLLYPKGFRTLVEKQSKKNAHPDWLLYALIRTESFFNPLAVSHAGAQGLTQLMPATAADVKRRLGLQGIDIIDPQSNIAIGSWYLAHMIARSPSPIEALMAYNAGMTHVRRWRAVWADLPLDLFVEVVPFAETRNYAKRLTRDSLVYGQVHGLVAAVDVLSCLFPRELLE